LNIETAERRGGAEHFTLDLAGLVPGRFPARGRIHAEDQASALACRLDHRRRAHPFDEGVDRSLARFLRKIFVATGHGVLVESLRLQYTRFPGIAIQ
jgi:hypothetical protein